MRGIHTTRIMMYKLINVEINDLMDEGRLGQSENISAADKILVHLHISV